MSLTGRIAVIIHADALAGLARCADNSAQCCVTSPPYFGLRDYSVEEGREYIGIDINSDYCELAEKRLSNVAQQLSLFSGGVENGNYEESTDNEQCEEKGLAVSGQGLPDEYAGCVRG